VRPAYRDRWDRRTATTPAGELAYVVCPGPEPFIGSARLDGRPIAPLDAHRVLELLGHADAGLCYLGDTWAANRAT
jgi:hypothetical protein